MRVYRLLRGVATFEVRKDRSVVLIDLQVLGVKSERRSGVRKYAKHFEIMSETLKSLGFHLPRRSEELVLKFKGRLVLCKLYYDEDLGVVRYVALASFSPSILSRLARGLVESGWRRLLLLEFKPLRALQRRW